MFRNDYSTIEIETLTQCALPQPNGYWIRKRSELVEEDDFLLFDAFEFTAAN